MPTKRIFIYVLYMLLKVTVGAYYVIMEPGLPNVFFKIFVTKPFEGRNKTRTNVVRSANICRDRRPRLSGLLLFDP